MGKSYAAVINEMIGLKAELVTHMTSIKMYREYLNNPDYYINSMNQLHTKIENIDKEISRLKLVAIIKGESSEYP